MITVISPFPDILFSSQVPDLRFTLTEAYASVAISVDGTEVYREMLHATGGVVEVCDLGGLLGVYAERRLSVSVSIGITEGGASAATATLQFLLLFSRADVGVSASDFYGGHFLSVLSGPKVTAPGRLEYLHYYGTEAPACTATYSDGSTRAFTPAVSAGNSRYTQIDVSPDCFMAAGLRLVSYVVTAGSRSQQYDMDPTQPDCAPILLFDNSFGVQELIYCTGLHKVSPEYSRHSARLGGLLRNYDIEETRRFQADTGVLTTAMANWADELFRSREVYVVNIYDGVPTVGKQVVITDSKSEYSNDDASLPRFTFTYQYAQRIHNVLQLPREGRIFDNTYDNTFN